MAVKWYNYAALATSTAFTNADTTNAALIGATTTGITNGTLTVVADAPAGLSKSIEGTTQSVSGTCYVTETITATNNLSISVYWKMPTSVGTIGANLFYAGNGTTRVFLLTLLSTEQVRLVDAVSGSAFTSTFAGAFVAGQWYRTDIGVTVATSTTGVVTMATYTEHSTTALTNTTFTSSTANLGALQINTLRHGPRSSTSTADENIRVRAGYDPASAYLIGPQIAGTLSASIPRATATITGTQTNPGTLTASLPVLTGTVAGTQTNPGALSASTPRATATITGQSTNSGTVAGTLPLLTSAVTGTSVNPGTLLASTIMPTATLTGDSVNPGTLTASLPVLTGALTGVFIINVPRPHGALTLSGTVTGRTLTGTATNRTLTGTVTTRTLTVED